MRIEEMTSGRLRKATPEELRDLRRRCVNLWVKYGFANGATRSTEISRAEFLSKYSKLRLEMRARSIEPRKLVTLDGLVVEEIRKAETLAGVEGCEEVVLFSEAAYDILMRKRVLGDNGEKRMFVEFAVEKKLTPGEEADSEAETEKIRESRKTKGAQNRHKFQPAKWTEKNGHPRCKVCGMEEPTSGICQGVEEWPDDWKNAIAKFQVSKPETTETSRRIPVAPIGPNADIRTITINAGEGITALYDTESKRVVTYIFDREKWTMAEARKWIEEHKSAVAKTIMEKIRKGGPGSGNFGHEGVPGEKERNAPGGGQGENVGGLSDSEKTIGLKRLGEAKRVHDRARASIPNEKESIDLSEVFEKPAVQFIVRDPGKNAAMSKEIIAVKDLEPIQPYVDRNGVERYIKDLPNELPTVVEYRGRMFVTAGHTRIAAQVFSGRKSVLVERYKMDEHGKYETKKISKGGPGSGNFGHEGVPGQRGGSAPGGGSGERNDFGEIKTLAEANTADDFGRTKLDPAGDSLRKYSPQYNALDDYQSAGYTDVNDYLRTGNENLSEAQATVRKLDGAMNEIKSEAIVYRGIDDPGFQRIEDKIVVGAEFLDKGFVSTSLIKETAEDVGGKRVTFRIKVPKGSKGFYYDKRIGQVNEHELLLARNCRFRVSSIKHDFGKVMVDAELVGQGD